MALSAMLPLCAMAAETTSTSSESAKVSSAPEAKTPTVPDVSPEERARLELIISDILIKKPEIISNSMMEYQRRQKEVNLEMGRKLVAQYATSLFTPDGTSAILGNPKGKKVMVEFFDYNCGVCHNAATMVLDLVKSEPELKVVMKELPILGEESTYAAKMALAARKQNKYSEFHVKLITANQRLSLAKIDDTAKDVGLNMDQLKKDMLDPEIEATLEKNRKLAMSLNLPGTPSFIIGETIFPGLPTKDAILAAFDKK